MNILQSYLDHIGLPWRTSRYDLIARYGLDRCYWSDAQVVELELASPPVPGLLRPLQFRDEPTRAQHLPPTYFSGYADPRGEALGNLQAMAEAVAAVLGPGEYSDQSANSRSYAWSAGPARLKLHAFPPRLQDPRNRNRWHEREPRLREAGSISIDSGYRPPLSDEERAWVEAFAPGVELHSAVIPPPPPRRARRQPGLLARLLGAKARPATAAPLPQPAWANAAQAHVGNIRATEVDLEYVREPPPEVERVFGKLGVSSSGEALVWCDEQLRIVPSDFVQNGNDGSFTPKSAMTIDGLKVTRVFPGSLGMGMGFSVLFDASFDLAKQALESDLGKAAAELQVQHVMVSCAEPAPEVMLAQ